MTRTLGCTCGELRINGRGTGSFNLDLDCPTHGVESEWYRSEEQVEKRRASSERLRALQVEAARRRREYRQETET